jgi:hypothetical protein
MFVVNSSQHRCSPSMAPAKRIGISSPTGHARSQDVLRTRGAARLRARASAREADSSLARRGITSNVMLPMPYRTTTVCRASSANHTSRTSRLARRSRPRSLVPCGDAHKQPGRHNALPGEARDQRIPFAGGCRVCGRHTPSTALWHGAGTSARRAGNRSNQTSVEGCRSGPLNVAAI